MAADHIEKAWEVFERTIGYGPVEASSLRAAFFAGAYASYVLAVTLSGTAGVEEGARVMTELADEFDRYLAARRSDGV
jgi:hypothetical protein